jgi:hypothetical protein
MRMMYLFVASLLALLGCGGASYDAAAPQTAEVSGGMAPPPPPAEAGPMMEAEESMPMDADDSSTARAEPPAKPGGAAGMPGIPQPAPAPPPAKPDAPPAPKPTEVAGDKTIPLLIYRATFHMAVYEATPSIDAVQKTAMELGGYLVRRDPQQIIVRVPAEKYREALTAIAKLGDVLHREETVEDVTDQYYDLQARLRSNKVVRDRLEQLLAQAKNVNEALQVERELGRVSQEIERIEGRLKLLRELISFSTITVLFRARPSDTVGSTVKLPFPWLDDLNLQNPTERPPPTDW